MYKVHLDTDLGGDIDDLCALAMLLRWSGKVELNGITTVAEANGRRAGYARYVLGLEGRNEIPVAAGADVAQGFYRYAELSYTRHGHKLRFSVVCFAGLKPPAQCMEALRAGAISRFQPAFTN